MEAQNDEIVAFSTPPKDPVEIWLQLLDYCKRKRARIQLYAKAPTEEVSYRLNIINPREDICRWLPYADLKSALSELRYTPTASPTMINTTT